MFVKKTTFIENLAKQKANFAQLDSKKQSLLSQTLMSKMCMAVVVAL